jgi:hypothetical protein
MSPIRTVPQVFDAIQRAKAGAPEFCTNFFPVQRRLQEWIDHEELQGDFRDGAAFYFRRDRDFQRLYFCAASTTALKSEIARLPELASERIVVELVGNEPALDGTLQLWEAAGFRRHSKLCRMSRTTRLGVSPDASGPSPTPFAETGDCPGILALLENTFDPYGEQIPTPYEIEAAVKGRRILVIRQDGRIGGLLFFETQGLTSILRFWVVAPECRARRFGSTLMHQFFSSQRASRRFLLWVATDNLQAVQKYRHYGYVSDGLVDHVLANELIRS